MKRVLDFLLTLLLFLFLSPLFFLITFVLYFSNNGNPFFIQKRPGKDGKIFDIIKFKTMNDKMDLGGNLLPGYKRITKIGQFIRNSSLDEIPQLINVIRGDMSIIGPRPLLTAYLPLYNEEQAKRHNVRPGITGWAQVNGRNTISWEEKFNLDIWYVNNISFKIDIVILIKTIKKVIQKEGISASDKITMEMFTGTKT